MSFRKMLPFLFANIIVSLVVVVTVLILWDKRHPQNTAQFTPQTAATVVSSAAAANGLVSDSAETNNQSALSTDPTPTTVPQPTKQCEETHTVRAGDTMGGISAYYDVPMGEIVLANGDGFDPEFVYIDQTIIIPLCGIDAPAAVEAENNDPIATAEIETGESTIVISEIRNVGDLSVEQTVLTNIGQRVVELEGWTLQDESGKTYTFGKTKLFGDGAALIVFSGVGEDNFVDYYWRLSEPAWQAGETATLFDAAGNVQATFVIPNLEN